LVDELMAGYATTFGTLDTTSYRAAVLRRLEVANDPGTSRYLQLLAQVNGWPPQPDLSPVFDWFIHALRTHARP
jgi:hypothetical protein